MARTIYMIGWASIVITMSESVWALVPVALHVRSVTSIGRSFKEKIGREDFARRTLLFYLDGNEKHNRVDHRGEKEDDVASRIDDGSPTSRWLSSIFNVVPRERPPEENTRQKDVDGYLEFLDRRYNRLHPKKTKDKKQQHAVDNRPKFNALKWLTQPTTTCGDDEECVLTPDQEEDALYVLGVAGLASERLLQKHNLLDLSERCSSSTSTSGKDKGMDTGVVIDATATMIDDCTTDIVTPVRLPKGAVTKVAVSFLKAGDSVLRRVQSRRQALIAYQMKKANDVLSLMGKSLISTPKTIADLWILGGGKKMFLLTISIVATILLFLRPFVHDVATSGSYINP